MVAISLISIIWKIFKLPTPTPKVWIFGFLSVDGNGISVSAFMKKLKNGCHFFNINHMENFQITATSPKVWISGFQSVDVNLISASVIMKKLKNGCHFFNINSYRKISNYQPSQSLDLWFSECSHKFNIRIGHYEKIEKWLPFF